MHLLKRVIYRAAVESMRLYRDFFLDLRVFGRRNIPPGPKIYATNHISSTDPYWVLPEYPEPVHIVVGPGYKSRWAAMVLDYFEQINASAEARKSAVDQAIAYLKRGEPVYNAPEGDLQEPFQLGRFYPGIARMYRRTLAPIIPIALVAPPRALRAFPRFDIHVEGRVYRAVLVLRGPYCISIGRPFTPELRNIEEAADNERIMNELRDRIAALVADVRRRMNW